MIKYSAILIKLDIKFLYNSKIKVKFCKYKNFKYIFRDLKYCVINVT